MTTNVTRTITLAMAIGIGLTACGGSDTAESNSGELGDAGHWTNLRLCALTTPDEISAEFGVDVDKQPAIDSPDGSRCRWNQKNGDPLALWAASQS